MKSLVRRFLGSERSGPFLYLFSEGIAKGVQFLTIPLYTALLTKAQFGALSLFWISVPLFSVAIDLSQRSSIKRQYLTDPNSIYKFLHNVQLSILMIGLLLYGVFSIVTQFQPLITPGYDKWLIISAALFALTEAYLSLNQISKQVNRYNILYIARQTLPHVIALILIYKYQASPEIFAPIQVGVFAILAAFTLWVIFKKIDKISFSWASFVASITFSLPVIPAILSALLLSFSDRFFIQYYSGSEALAEYTIAYTVASMLSVVFLATNKAWQPFMLHKLKSNDFASLRRRFLQYFGFIFILLIVLTLLRKPLILFFADESYLLVANLVPVILLGMFFYFLYTAYSNIAFFHRKMWYFASPAIVAACSNLILNFIFIPKYGFEAAAYTTLIAYFLEFLMVVVVSYRVFKINLLFSEVK